MTSPYITDGGWAIPLDKVIGACTRCGRDLVYGDLRRCLSGETRYCSEACCREDGKEPNAPYRVEFQWGEGPVTLGPIDRVPTEPPDTFVEYSVQARIPPRKPGGES